jgi:hypothetical protein
MNSLGDPNLFGVIGQWKNLSTMSVEEYMYSKANKKLSLNRQFERAIKSISIDCDLNKNGNIIRLDEKYEPVINHDSIWNIFYENYSSGEVYIRKGLRSINKSLPMGIVEFNDILNNTAKKYDVYVFENVKTGEIITTDKSLIIPEDIDCDSGNSEYSFDKVPEDLKKITINNSYIPKLMEFPISNIKNYLKNVMDEVVYPNDPMLKKKLFKFIKQSDYSKKKSIIKKLTDLGVGDASTPWELQSIEELTVLLNGVTQLNSSLIVE